MVRKSWNGMRRRFTAFDAFVYAFLIFVVIVTFYPFWQVFIISVNDAIDTLKGGLYFFPRKFTLNSYIVVLREAAFLSSLLVTVSRTVIGTLGSLAVVSMAAYVLSRTHLVGRKAISLTFMFTMYFGGGLIPYYMILKTFWLIDKFWVFIFPNLLDVFSILLIMTYMRSLPGELEESARIDGANDWKIFYRIIFPLSLPILATVGLFTAIGHWNAWFDSYAFTYGSELKTLGAYLVNILNQYATRGMQSSSTNLVDQRMHNPVSPESIRMAVTIVATLPILMVYPFVQRYFVKGIMIGAIKA